MLNLLQYGVIVLPAIIIFTISLLRVIINVIRGYNPKKFVTISHGLVLFTIVAFFTYWSNFWRPDVVMIGVLKDDLYNYQLTFRKEGEVEHEINGMFGYRDVIRGQYKQEGNLLIFIEKPYDNDFLSDTLTIDREKEALFLGASEVSSETKKEWLNHYELIRY